MGAHRSSMDAIRALEWKKPHHCIHPDISGMLDSFRMYIKYVMPVVGRVSQVITFVKSLWLMAQNLKEVFSSYIVWRSLNDPEDGEVTLFPLRLGSQLSPSNMVAKQVSEVYTAAKLVNEISADTVMPEEIIYQINMLGFGEASPSAASVPVPDAGEETLTEVQLQEAVAHYLNSTGTSGKFFDSLRPPGFSGERKDFGEVWQQRFK